jgi:hypothetical protein
MPARRATSVIESPLRRRSRRNDAAINESGAPGFGEPAERSL